MYRIKHDDAYLWLIEWFDRISKTGDQIPLEVTVTYAVRIFGELDEFP